MRSLIRLPCLLVGCSSSECHRWAGSDGVGMLSVYIPILTRFADDDSAPPRIRKHVFKALSSAIRHHAAEGVAEEPLPMDESIMLGLTHKSRSVRLAAGCAYSVVDLLQSSQSHSDTRWSSPYGCMSWLARMLLPGKENTSSIRAIACCHQLPKS